MESFECLLYIHPLRRHPPKRTHAGVRRHACRHARTEVPCRRGSRAYFVWSFQLGEDLLRSFVLTCECYSPPLSKGDEVVCCVGLSQYVLLMCVREGKHGYTRV